MSTSNDTVIHLKSEQEYDALMRALKDQGYRWFTGSKPTSIDAYSEDRCIHLDYQKLMTHCDLEYFKRQGCKIISVQQYLGYCPKAARTDAKEREVTANIIKAIKMSRETNE
jgi:hypothetical protein